MLGETHKFTHFFSPCPASGSASITLYMKAPFSTIAFINVDLTTIQDYNIPHVGQSVLFSRARALLMPLDIVDIGNGIRASLTFSYSRYVHLQEKMDDTKRQFKNAIGYPSLFLNQTSPSITSDDSIQQFRWYVDFATNPYNF